MRTNDDLSALLSSKIDHTQNEVFNLSNRPFSIESSSEDEISFKLAILQMSTAFNAQSTNSDFKFNVSKRIIDGF